MCLLVEIPQFIPVEMFHPVMVELAEYLTSIPDQVRLISPTAMFLQITAEIMHNRFRYECCARYTMSETEGAASGHRSFELWMDLPLANNAPEGDGWELSRMFTFRDGGNLT